MNIDSVLIFVNQHNTLIIEVLLGLVIVGSLFLAYRGFFNAKAGQEVTTGAEGGLDTAQLEKTLQKILENQSHTSKGTSEDLSVHVNDAELDSDAGAELLAQTAQLKSALNDSSKKIEILQAQLLEAQLQAETALASAPVAANAASSDAGLSGAEQEDLNGKIRDLEARLAEYEIISEDIADLSKYREENDDLKKQIEILQVGGETAAAPMPVPSLESTQAAADTFDEVSAEIEKEISESASPATPGPSETAAVVADPAVDSNVIDDELMQEFAAAVEGQKNLSKAGQKAGDGSTSPETAGDDTDKLMDQFENFVTKKS